MASNALNDALLGDDSDDSEDESPQPGVAAPPPPPPPPPVAMPVAVTAPVAVAPKKEPTPLPAAHEEDATPKMSHVAHAKAEPVLNNDLEGDLSQRNFSIDHDDQGQD